MTVDCFTRLKLLLDDLPASTVLTSNHLTCKVQCRFCSVALQADSADYNPEDDSDYDAPKKTSSSKKKKVSSSGKAKKGRRAADRDTDSEDDAPAANSAQVAKAAAAALRSIKSTINAQMVYNPSIKCELLQTGIAARLT